MRWTALVILAIIILVWTGYAERESFPEEGDSDHHEYSPAYSAIRKAMHYAKHGCRKYNEYLRKPEHQIATLTLLAVAFYTYLTWRLLNTTQGVGNQQHADASMAFEQASSAASAALAQASSNASEQQSDTERALKDAENSAAQQHADTLAALDRAQAANDLVRKQMELDERAWLSVLVHSDNPVVGRTMTLQMPVINSAKTPALDVTSCTGNHHDVGKPYGRPGAQPAFRCTSGWSRPTLVPPNGTWTPEAYMPATETGLSKPVVDALNDGELIVWFFGKVAYRDIFGCSHWTEFCYVRNVPNKQEGPVWRNCPAYNRTDDANRCQKQ